MLFIKMKYKKKLLFLFILFVFANKIFADDYSSVQQNINLQYQQQQRDIELKARQTPIADEEQIIKDATSKQKNNKQVFQYKKQQETKQDENNQKNNIKKINIVYNRNVIETDEQVLNKIIKQYENTKLDMNSILCIKDFIKQYYINKGYFLVQVDTDFTQIKEHILTFIVTAYTTTTSPTNIPKYSIFTDKFSLFLLNTKFYCKQDMQQSIENEVEENEFEKTKNSQQSQQQVKKQKKKHKNKIRKKITQQNIELKQETEKVYQNLRFEKIEVIYNREVSNIYKRSLNKIVSKYENKYLEVKDILKIQEEIQNYYIKKGYFLAKVCIDTQKIQENKLIFIVNEGYIDNIIFKTGKGKKYSKFRNALTSFSFFPFYKNSAMNIKDIDQGLEQINRLQSQRATTKFLPSQRIGFSSIEITNTIKHPINISATVDNSGSKSTGVYRQNYTIGIDNLFCLNDNINFSLSKTLPIDAKDKDNKSYFANINIPFGYFLFMASFFDSNYNYSNRTYTGSYLSDGSTKNYNASIEAVISRSKKHKLSFGCEFALKETENFFNKEKLDVSSQKLSIATTYTTLLWYFKNASLYSKLSYSKGFDNFDATVNNNNSRDMPKAQFQKVDLYTQYSKQFVMPLIKRQMMYSLVVNMQYSKDILYSCEQISIGGQNSVRGFKEESSNGDSGGYITNTVSVNFANIFKTRKLNIILANTKLNCFVDYGCVYSNLAIRSYQLAGAGAGLVYNIKYFNISGTWAKQIFNDANLKDEKDILYLSAQLRLYF